MARVTASDSAAAVFRAKGGTRKTSVTRNTRKDKTVTIEVASHRNHTWIFNRSSANAHFFYPSRTTTRRCARATRVPERVLCPNTLCSSRTRPRRARGRAREFLFPLRGPDANAAWPASVRRLRRANPIRGSAFCFSGTVSGRRAFVSGRHPEQRPEDLAQRAVRVVLEQRFHYLVDVQPAELRIGIGIGIGREILGKRGGRRVLRFLRFLFRSRTRSSSRVSGRRSARTVFSHCEPREERVFARPRLIEARNPVRDDRREPLLHARVVQSAR